MIPASEIRFGNWIRHNNTFCKEEMKVDAFLFKDNLCDDIFPEFDPIPLTKEILVSAGFVLVNPKERNYNLDIGTSITYSAVWNDISKDIHCFGIADYDDETNTEIVGYRYFAWHITSVHQLQNLYYSLTGKELEITL